MNLNHGIKKLFLIPTIVSVTISFLSIKSAYAEGSDVYKPNYTWAEEPQRTFQAPDFSKYAYPIQDPIAFQAQDFSKYAYPIQDPIAFQAQDFSKYAYPIQDPIAFQTQDFSRYANPIQDPIVFQTPDFSRYANPIQDPIAFQTQDFSRYANPIQDPIVFQTPDFSKYANPIQDPIVFQTPDFSKYANLDVYRPSYTWADRTKAIGEGYLAYSADKASQGLSGFFGGFNLGERLGSVIERGLSGQITSEEMGRQYVLEMWRTFVPIVGEPVYQEYIHNPSAFETTPFSTTQIGMHNISATSQLLSHNSSEAFQVPDLSKYPAKRIDFHSLEAISTRNLEHIAQNSMLTNPAIYDKYTQNSMLTNPAIYDKYTQSIQPQIIQPHYNTIGRSFQQQQHYQPLTIPMPRFEPTQIPRYEPMYIPQVPMPVYQPPAIPNF